MKTTIVIFILTTLTLAVGAQAAKCKFEIKEVDQIETRLLLLFRGGFVGLSGRFGLRSGKPYLKALYQSNFKARAQFSENTPLQLHLADGRSITLNVISDATADLQFGHIITGSRQAQPLFAITAQQWKALLESPIVSLHMPFDAKGERRSETRDVKGKHAERIMAAVKCITQEGHVIPPLEPALRQQSIDGQYLAAINGIRWIFDLISTRPKKSAIRSWADPGLTTIVSRARTSLSLRAAGHVTPVPYIRSVAPFP